MSKDKNIGEQTINFAIDHTDIFKHICPYCGGTGHVSAMQSVAFIGGGSTRGQDTTVNCSACHGTGRRES